MRIIGLTGGIACGKSSVAGILAEFGVKICDVDVLAKDAVRAGSSGLRAVVQEFGVTFLDPNGELNREKLGAVVFNDPPARRRLEKIIHPLVRRAVEEQLAVWQREGIEVAAVMAPLLLETGMEKMVDEVWVVLTPTEVQVERLIRRNGLSKEAALSRMAAQWSQEEKRQRADLVILNDGSPVDLAAKVSDIWAARFGSSVMDHHGGR